MSLKIKSLLFSGLLLTAAAPAEAAIFTVTNTLDAGAGSLRQAILNANASAGADIIQFNIATSGNTFEGSGVNQYAVIQLATPLPVITEAVFIDGTTQANTNTGTTPVRTAGRDGLSLGGIPLPDVYIVPSSAYVFPTGATGTDGNGISINAAGVELRGLAISGFGNSSTNGGNASSHADVSVLRAPSARTVNIHIRQMLLSCDPTGAQPALAHRRTKGNSLLVLGNNEYGIIENNHIAFSGTYGIHFNGNTDNLSVGPTSTTLGNTGWQLTGNVLLMITTNASLSSITRVIDGINLMKCSRFRITRNYISDVEQSAMDLGFNSDHNYIADNTITDITRTNAVAPQCGIRIVLASERDTVHRNLIFSNTSANLRSAVWLDRTTLTQTGVVSKANGYHLIRENLIHGNAGSGIVVSNNGSGTTQYNTFTRNSIYSNGGLGIDLDLTGTTGAPAVTPNDDGDTDAGVNDLMNFPIIDSVRFVTSTQLAVYGKAPAGSLIEFFLADGETNNMGGFYLNYGEGRTFLGSGFEGGEADMRTGTASYATDNNFAAAEPRFHILVPVSGVTASSYLTATATLNGNTSEFSPTTMIFTALAVKLLHFSATPAAAGVTLKWKGDHDGDFLYYEVEHSRNGHSFTTLQRIYPNTLTGGLSYQYLHRQPEGGRNYYRLKMVNGHEKTVFSNILAVGVNPLSGVTLKGGSLGSGELMIESPVAGPAGLQVISLSGQVLGTSRVSLTGGLQRLTLPGGIREGSGVCLVQLTVDGASRTWKLQ